jgi:O-methyltransferase involved in polyketide biosynthesis
MINNLKGIPETLLIPLWARAVEINHPSPIIKDYKAIEMLDQIEYNFKKFDDEWATQISIAVRTEILDDATREFMDKFPDAVIVNIGCGLDTRFSRLNNGKIYWYDLDLPEVINLRRQFFIETDHYQMIGKSVFDYTWIQKIPKEKPVLIIVEGLFMYLTKEEVVELLNMLVKSFEGGEMLVETIPPFLVKQNKKHDIIKKQYQMDVQFNWGIKNGKELEKINPEIKFIEEWHYFDYHRDRWKSIRWLSLIPFFKNRFGNRIIHLKFE